MNVFSEQGFTDASALLGPGIYALCFSGEVVYIGKAVQLLARIHTHRIAMQRAKKGQLMFSMKEVHFSKVMIFPCAEADLDRMERALIAKYNPRYNVKLRTVAGYKLNPRKYEERPTKLVVNGTELVINVGVPNERAITRRV